MINSLTSLGANFMRFFLNARSRFREGCRIEIRPIPSLTAFRLLLPKWTKAGREGHGKVEN